MEITLKPIGVFRSCFKEKFGIPRQSGLIPNSPGYIELLPSFKSEHWVRGIESYSHIWILFSFHKNVSRDVRPLIRPPRLGGNKKLGVFASRSGFRPNAIGMSAVKLLETKKENGLIRVHVRGADILDETPVIDIKPYLPYADAISDATSQIAQNPPPAPFSVHFSRDAEKFIESLSSFTYPDIRTLIIDILSRDHRPAYYQRTHPKESFGMKFYDFDIQWTIRDHQITVMRIENIMEKKKDADPA